ncbi:MAG: hypothetical protein R2780_15235 [Crocinitomicaceae bacterium]|nr:hypothetical protein [Crocinitomicaceae bacterium]
MKKLFIFCLSVALVIVACSKEQRVVNKLEGTWKGTSAKANVLGFEIEVPLDGIDIIYTFNPCKVNKGFCNGTYQLDTYTDDFTYTIGNKGTTIDWIDSSGTTQSIDILELEKTTFKVKEDFGLDSTGIAEVTVTFTKQN